MEPSTRTPLVAIACGGTGGHLFPGVAVADALEAEGVSTVLLISQKDVDQQAVQGLPAGQVVRLPGVALTRGRWSAFVRGLGQSLRVARRLFRERPPAAVLAMGGFTSLPPVWAGRWRGAATYLHEANAIPGRANRWLAWLVDEAFVQFPEAAERLWHPRVRVVGMPVRSRFQRSEPAAARLALGLRPSDPVLLVTGGSQGAVALNDLVMRVVPALRLLHPRLQLLHLAGRQDAERVRRSYASQGIPALVKPFLTEMELALGAATAVIGRAGGSFLAEMAAMEVPGLLVPLPSAADNHQHYNALALVESGAARMLPQSEATPDRLLWELRALLDDEPLRHRMQAALARWHGTDAARLVADAIRAPLETPQQAGPPHVGVQARRNLTSDPLAPTPAGSPEAGVCLARPSP
jgi:UDP-N-acetylglucosamine--N-acetylmuramyl-(pentapeptide) pyrophosphoryl-undecaprenol N-acetylglucosamine transferase